MHDATNTLKGRYGFVATAVGGKRFTERKHLWDEVPRDARLVSLAIFDFEKNIALVTLEEYERYFFVNEGVSMKSQPSKNFLSAKILGGVNGESAVEARVELLDKMQRSQRTLNAALLPYALAVFRAGVVVRG